MHLEKNGGRWEGKKKGKPKPQRTIHGTHRGLQVLCFNETPQASLPWNPGYACGPRSDSPKPLVTLSNIT